MRLQRGPRDTTVNDPVRIAGDIADRMVLESAPGGATVASFVITRAAQRGWEAINKQLGDAHGALFWIVNGKPLGRPRLGADMFWRPDGDGYARIAVVDEDGNRAAVRVRVKIAR